MAGFIGLPNPIFDAANYNPTLLPSFLYNLLISYKRLGDELVKALSKSVEVDGVMDDEMEGGIERPTPLPDHAAVFQRSYSFVT
ncbi:uncharacterized protein A1O9_07474 [Exophiala aquamarina CBS 119918]|uniref:Uncharacterized protein n=1 Tax=Exophiala aquamarina CBS 119918 TaxID=1182545 RepID=A0A072P709_9EURO|nr:uncharacterized protein A1O9_07474 [Exophiala aquamarina CBS 119918]KEF55894.1 hypothetical protein A1O9_07474 [Exophiala aquamarina CBS 119918]